MTVEGKKTMRQSVIFIQGKVIGNLNARKIKLMNHPEAYWVK